MDESQIILVSIIIGATIGIMLGIISIYSITMVFLLITMCLFSIVAFIIGFIFDWDLIYWYASGFGCVGFVGVLTGIIGEKMKEDGKTLQQSSNSYIKSKPNNNYYVGQKVIGLSARKGYSKFSIAGAYYRNLSIDMVGKFNGYAIAQTDNEYDPYAIAIYNDAGIHLGFLPGGNRTLHQYIINEEGKVHAYGYLGWNNGIYGEVCVETNKNLVTKRNKPYQVN